MTETDGPKGPYQGGMVHSLGQLQALNQANAQVREELRAQVQQAGDEFRDAESHLNAARFRLLDVMVAAADTGLLSKELIWQDGRVARTTLFNELERRNDPKAWAEKQERIRARKRRGAS